MSVSHYASRLIKLSYFAPKLIATEIKKDRKFLKGLRADIYDRVTMMKLATYTEALKNAQLAEELLAASYQ